MDSLVPVPTSEVGVWQLRRVGPPSTVQNSASLIRLIEDGEVTIGRGPAADYFLDSAVTLRLISRIHASIKGEKIAGGHPRFTIINSGLNGTYINDLKMRSYPDNQQVLLEGDRITFGHPGCASIQPGAYAPQHDSEFQFIFECVPASRAGSTERYRSHARVTPLSGNPRYSHYQKQCMVITTGIPSSRSTDSPQSNASTSEKENEVTSSVFRDVKNMPSTNGGYARSPSKYQHGVHECIQLDSKQIRAVQYGEKPSQVICIDKVARLNGVGMDDISHSSSVVAQNGNSDANLSVFNASTNRSYSKSSVNLHCSNTSVNLNCSSSGVNLNCPNTGVNLSISNLIKSSKAVPKGDSLNRVSLRNVAMPASAAQSEMVSLSPTSHSALMPVSVSKTLDKSSDNFKEEIKFNSTVIILSDKLEEDENSDADESDNDDDDCNNSEVEFVSSSEPTVLTRINLKADDDESNNAKSESEDIDVVECENEDIVNNENKDIDVTEHENGEINNEIRDVIHAENEKNIAINSENEDSEFINDEGNIVTNDSDGNMPQLVLIKDSVNADSSEMQDSEEGMPPLMLMGDLSHINSYVREQSGAQTMKTALFKGRENGHMDTIDAKEAKTVSKTNQRAVVLSSLDTSLSSDRIDSASSAVACLPRLLKSCTNSLPESVKAAQTLPRKDKFSNIPNTDSGMSKSVLVQTRPEPCVTTHVIQLRSGSCDSDDAESDLSESCDVKPHLEEPSRVFKYEPVLGSGCGNRHGLSSVNSVTTPITHLGKTDKSNVSVDLFKAERNHLSAVAHSHPSSEQSPNSRGVWEYMASNLPSSLVSSVKSPSSHAPTSSALLPSKATTPKCELRTTNTTTIVLSSGNEHKDLSSKSCRKESGKSSKHKNHCHKLSSESSSSSRLTSSSLSHSSFSDESVQYSRTSFSASDQNSRPSSGASDQNSRPSSDAAVPNSRLSASASVPNSRSSMDASLRNSRSSSGASLPNPVSPTGTSVANQRSPSGTSLPSRRSSLEASLPKSKLCSGSSPKSRQSSESSSQNSGISSGSMPKKFFKDTIPNMYSSSDEESTLHENKTKIVKKIYSSAKGKQEVDAVREVSRRSALFKMQKHSAVADTSHSPSVSTQPPAATHKHKLPGFDLHEPSKTEKRDSSSVSSPPTSDLSDIEGMDKKISRNVSDTKLEKKTENKSSELPREVIRPKPSVNKQPIPSSSSLSLTSLPWLAEVNRPNNSRKNSSTKQIASSKVGLNVKTTALMSTKNGTVSSEKQAGRKDTSLTRSSSSVAKSRTLSTPAAKTSQGLSTSQTTRLKPEIDEVSKSKLAAVSVSNIVEKSSKPKTLLQTNISSSSIKGKDLTSSSGKTSAAGRVNGLKRTHSNEKSVDMKNGTIDSDEPVSKRRDLKLSSSQASSLSKSKPKSSSPPRDKANSHLDKPGAERSRRKNMKADSVLSNSLPKGKSKKSSSSKKGKPSRAKKKRKKIVSDTSSDDENNDANQDDDDEDDFDVEDMMEEEDDDSDESESWDLPDGVQYYDNLCSARKCLNPEGKQVDWVMCDKCEQWYHVVCIDCTIDVHNEDIPFHCGLC